MRDRDNPVWARRRGVEMPIETDTLERAAAELDLPDAAAEVYRSAPDLLSPRAVWGDLSAAMPEQLR